MAVHSVVFQQASWEKDKSVRQSDGGKRKKESETGFSCGLGHVMIRYGATAGTTGLTAGKLCIRLRLAGASEPTQAQERKAPLLIFGDNSAGASAVHG